jgi:CubicO group peptidase (beta-lactamase class C family)
MKIRNTNRDLSSKLLNTLSRAAVALLLAFIFGLGQAAEFQAQTRTGRQPSTGTTPQQERGVGDITDGAVEINFERLSLKLALALQNNTVGYGFAVFHNGQLRKVGSGGFARRSPDTTPAQQIPFERESRVDIASSTKTITSIAVLKALEMKGKTDQELIHKYLPSNWKVPASVKKLTFRDVLSHHSGLKKVTDGSYDGIRQSIEAGVSPDYKVGDYSQSDDDYQNINFVLCRVLLPYIMSDKIAITENDPTVGAKTIALYFAATVRDLVFKPAGINKPVDFKPWDESGKLTKVPLIYNYKDSSVAGLIANDHTLDCGAGGLFINAIELAQVMSALENNKILSLKTRLMMKQHDLGIFRVGGSAYWTHSGGFSDSKGRGTSTRLVLCPNNVQVAIVINSSGNDLGSTFQIVKDAFEDSTTKP